MKQLFILAFGLTMATVCHAQFNWLCVKSEIIPDSASVTFTDYDVHIPFTGRPNDPVHVVRTHIEDCVDYVVGSSNSSVPWTARFDPIHYNPYPESFTLVDDLTAGDYHVIWDIDVTVEAGVEQWDPRREAQYGVWSDQRTL